jgi:hypothetical protein
MDFIIKLEEHFSFPLALVVLGVVLVPLFRKQIRALIDRTISISASVGGITASAPPAPQPVLTNPTAAPSLSSPDFARQVAANVDPYVLDQRINAICAEFDSHGIKPGQREDALIQLLAGALTREAWERIYLFIFGAQLRLLNRLNETPGGLTEADIQHVYSTAAAQHPEMYQPLTFETWMAFVEQTGLVTRNGDRYLIAPYGRGFLKYLVAQGLTSDRAG